MKPRAGTPSASGSGGCKKPAASDTPGLPGVSSAVKVGILVLSGVAIYLVSGEAMSSPLAYFVFFPMVFLALLYFLDAREWFYFAVLLLGVLTAYFYSLQGKFPAESLSLAGISLAGFAFIMLYRLTWEVGTRGEEKKCKELLASLSGLKEKHATRVESLLHLEKQVASLINLFEIARDFNECLDFKETAQVLYKKVLPELSFERAELVVLARDKTPPVISRVYVISREGVEEKTCFPPESLEYEWLEKGAHQKNFVAAEGLWLFPLVLEGEFNGLFCVQGAEKQDLAKFEVLTSQLTLQVRRVSLYEMVRALSIIDGLTGVFVRRHFLERFEEEIRRALKYGFSLSVLMLDIDHFKRYNDEFGHLVGDATLREVAEIIRASVRNVDIVARYGGEEFTVVIPETREEGTQEVAERIRSAVARHAFKVYDADTRVTVSIGISVFPHDLSTPPKSEYDSTYLFDLLQKADRALYRAKEEGRNRVVAYRSLGLRS